MFNLHSNMIVMYFIGFLTKYVCFYFAEMEVVFPRQVELPQEFSCKKINCLDTLNLSVKLHFHMPHQHIFEVYNSSN